MPVQLLCNIIVKREPDTLPAVKTTERLLCSLLPEYNVFHVKVQRIIRQELKARKSNSK